jgi:hypothetical protein
MPTPGDYQRNDYLRRLVFCRAKCGPLPDSATHLFFGGHLAKPPSKMIRDSHAGFFEFCGLLMAMSGLYGVIALVATQRTQ